MKFNLAVLPGDGVGPEVTAEGVKVLKAVGDKFGHTFETHYGLIGGCAIDKEGVAISEQTIKMCRKSNAVLLGAVGGPRWDDPLAKVRPEQGLLAVRKALKLFANLRPVKIFPQLVHATNLKPEIVDGVDFIFVRELTGGLYYGKPKKTVQTSRGRRAIDTMVYTEKEIARIVRVGFELARSRRKKLVSVDKANVLETSRLWRKIASEIAAEYPDVSLENMLVDSTSMRLIQSPKYFDVLVTENTFGDILTDESSMLAGSMGMLPSASLAEIPKAGARTFGLFEPSHGSAPRHTGKNDINPLATIMSVAMLLRYSLGLTGEAKAVDDAIYSVLQAGYRTYDIMETGNSRNIKLGTKEMGDMVAQRVAE